MQSDPNGQILKLKRSLHKIAEQQLEEAIREQLGQEQDAAGRIMSSRFWCKGCGFESRSGLYGKYTVSRHIESVHLKLNIACRFCGAKFSGRRYLRRHLTKKHFIKDTAELVAEVETHLENTPFNF